MASTGAGSTLMDGQILLVAIQSASFTRRLRAVPKRTQVVTEVESKVVSAENMVLFLFRARSHQELEALNPQDGSTVLRPN